VRPAWRRLAAAGLLAIGLAALTAVPAAAKDTYPLFGPLEIRIVGANGDLRDFVALSAEDRRGASLLVAQLTSAMQGASQPVESAAAGLPHYEIGVSHLGMTYVTTPWARMTETSFLYYPGGEGPTYVLVRFSQGNSATVERWLIPSRAVAAMIDQHARGLGPIGTEAGATGGSASWGIAVGAALLAGLTLILIEDRRRWRRGGVERSAGKGTDRRS
jgi:hypothetical protein